MEGASTISVLIVEDHEMVATALAAAVSREPDLETVGVVISVDAALEVMSGRDVDVVLLDLRLPGMHDSSVAIPALREACPRCRVVIVTGDADPRSVAAAMAHGCDGFLIKTQPIEQLLAGIRRAANGDQVLPEGLESIRLSPDVAALERRAAQLSAREVEVLTMLAAGSGTREIAEQLFLSVNTVRNHIQNAMFKLDAHSRLEAVSLAVRAGVISIG